MKMNGWDAMKPEMLVKAWNEGRLILLPVPLGTKIWRVHKSYIPKTDAKSIYCGWEMVYTYDEDKYSLEHYNSKDIYYSEESAREAVLERVRKND